MANPLVSVCMITYNHEPFSAQAIEGVLMQKTDFQIEVIIGEDCSTDNTRKICEEYEHHNQEKTHLLPSDKNLGVMGNFIRTLQTCRGKYIALLEGDDYWIDPLKLQKQVDFLEENDYCSLCYTNRYIVDEKGNILSEGNLPGPKKMYLTKEDVLGVFTPPMQTTMFLSKYLSRNLFNALKKGYNGDSTLSYFLIREGNFGYLDEITACYRQHPGGIYSRVNNSKRLEKTLENQKEIKRFFSKEDRVLLNRDKVSTLMRLYKEYAYHHQPAKLLKTAGQLILNDIQFKQLNFLKANYWLLKSIKNH